MNGTELIGFPHEVLFGFLRIATHKKLGTAAVPIADAKAVVDSWLELPHAKILYPDTGHYERVLRLTSDTRATGTLVSDAILASYAIHHRATLCSNDTDFARFPTLDWRNPLAVP